MKWSWCQLPPQKKNYPDEITWITWKIKQNLEIWPFLNSLLEKWVWESGPKIDPATGVSGMRFIEFVLVKTKRFVGSTINVLLTQHTCGQRSSMSARSKRWALVFYFAVWIWYMFPISNCRGESNLYLCTTSGLAKRMLLHIGEFRRILRPYMFF